MLWNLSIGVSLTANGSESRHRISREITEPTREVMEWLAHVLGDLKPYTEDRPELLDTNRVMLTVILAPKLEPTTLSHVLRHFGVAPCPQTTDSPKSTLPCGDSSQSGKA